MSNINTEKIKSILNDKVNFETIVGDLVNVPKNISVINNGVIKPLNDNYPNSFETLLEYSLEKELVLKPIDGNKGRGIIFFSAKENGVLINNSMKSLEEAEYDITKLNNYLVVEKIKQANYSEKIFPKTANTIRLLVMEDPDSNYKPFIARAVHRFGRVSTIPADNWSRGGLSAPINLETGRMGLGIMHPKHTNGELKYYKNHPDTEERIEGVNIPFWDEIKKVALDLTQQLNIKYVGWDILVTDNSFYFIEGNCNSDLDLIQVHEPLLIDSRVKRFLKANQYL